MLSFFYLFKLLQTDFTIRERRDKKYAKPRCVVDISLVGRRRKQRVVCRDERDERERLRRASFCVRTFNTNEESAVLDLPTVRHPLRSLFKTRDQKESHFSPLAKEEKKKKNLDSFFVVVSRSLFIF